MLRSTLYWLTLLASAIGVFATLWLGREFGRHSSRVYFALTAQRPAVTASDRALARHLERFLEDDHYSVHFTAGSASYPLDDIDGYKSIRRIGTLIPADSHYLIAGATDLPSAYRSYLDDRLALLGQSLGPDNAGSWRGYLEKIADATGRRDPKAMMDAHARAVKFLESTGARSTVQEARRIMISAGATPYAFEEPFAVSTLPARQHFPRLILSAPVASDDQIVKTDNFKVNSLDNKSLNFSAVTSISEVYQNALILRSWMKDDLIDDGVSLPREMRTRYFGTNGYLKNVPQWLVLSLGRDIRIKLPDDVDPLEFEGLRRKGACCILSNDNMNLALSSISVRQIGERYYRARTAPSVPIIVALISRRRSIIEK